tara:strand:+ start:3110 stop:3667 length:558 start_codon:yes stop_codon:yes gene_type:complete
MINSKEMKRKKTLLTLVLVLFGFISFGQTDFKWDVIVDSLESDKSELYSKSKLFIAEVYKSAQNVIQNDDKEAGIILVKGATLQTLYYQLNIHKWTFSYSIKFLVKDNKCRIIIEGVYCSDARVGIHDWPLMPVSNTYPESKGLRITGLNKKRYSLLMMKLKEELQLTVDLYAAYVKKPLVTKDW